MFFGRLRDGFAEAGEETLEVKLFNEDEIPWQELAFPAVTETLNRYYEMRHERTRQVYYADILNRPGEPLNIQRLP